MDFELGEEVIIENNHRVTYIGSKIGDDGSYIVHLVRRSDGKGWNLTTTLGKDMPHHLRNRVAILGFTDCFWYVYLHNIKKVV